MLPHGSEPRRARRLVFRPVLHQPISNLALFLPYFRRFHFPVSALSLWGSLAYKLSSPLCSRLSFINYTRNVIIRFF